MLSGPKSPPSMELICNKSRCLPEKVIYRKAEGSTAVLKNMEDAKDTAINNLFSVAKNKFRNCSGIFLCSSVKMS